MRVHSYESDDNRVSSEENPFSMARSKEIYYESPDESIA